MLKKGYLQWMSNYNRVDHYKADSFQIMSPCLSPGHDPLLLVQQLFFCVSPLPQLCLEVEETFSAV